MNRKTLLMTIVLLVTAMSAVSCNPPGTTVDDDTFPLEEETTAGPAPGEPDEPTPAASPSADADEQAIQAPSEPVDQESLAGMGLDATIDAAFGTSVVFGHYRDDTSNDLCLDLTGAAPLEIDCGDLADIEDCSVLFLGDGGPLAVLCAVTGALWGVDLGYEGAYTTATGERGEAGLSCRVSMLDGDGECTSEFQGESISYPPTVIRVGDHFGLALVAPPELTPSMATAYEEMRTTPGLEAVVLSTTVELERGSDQATKALTGMNSLVSLELNASILRGALATDQLVGFRHDF